MSDTDNTNLIMETLMGIKQDIGGLKSDVTHMRDSQTQITQHIIGRINKADSDNIAQDTKITAVEDNQKKWKWWVGGGLAVGSAVISGVVYAAEIFFGSGQHH